MKSWFKWLGIVTVVLCCVLYGRQAYVLLSGSGAKIAPALHLLPPSIGAYMLAYLAAAMGWHVLMRIIEAKASPLASLGIFTTSQFAKYLPGNIGHHAGRIFLSTRYGYPSHKVVFTMVAELAMVVLAMLLLSLPVLGQWSERFSLGLRGVWTAALVLLLMAVLGMVYAVLRKRGGHALFTSLSRSLEQAWATKARTVIHFVAAFLLISLQILLTVLALGLLDADGQLLSLEHLPTSIAVFSAAWLLGFLVPGAPAGIGVREMVLTEGLSPIIGRDHAVLLALLFRILTIMSDLLAFLAGACILWLSRTNQAVGHSD